MEVLCNFIRTAAQWARSKRQFRAWASVVIFKNSGVRFALQGLPVYVSFAVPVSDSRWNNSKLVECLKGFAILIATIAYCEISCLFLSFYTRSRQYFLSDIRNKYWLKFQFCWILLVSSSNFYFILLRKCPFASLFFVKCRRYMHIERSWCLLEALAITLLRRRRKR